MASDAHDNTAGRLLVEVLKNRTAQVGDDEQWAWREIRRDIHSGRCRLIGRTEDGRLVEVPPTAKITGLWAIDGFPISRIHQLAAMSGVPAAKLEAFSQKCQNAKRDGLHWYDTVADRRDNSITQRRARVRARDDDLRDLGRAPARDRVPQPALARGPESRKVVTGPPPPPLAYALYSLLTAYPFRRSVQGNEPDRHLLMSCARHLHAGKPWHLRPKGAIATMRLRANGGNGGWLVPGMIQHYRAVANLLNATETSADQAVVFLPPGVELPAGTDTPPPRGGARPR
jgi:hypothetical protein